MRADIGGYLLGGREIRDNIAIHNLEGSQHLLAVNILDDGAAWSFTDFPVRGNTDG